MLAKWWYSALGWTPNSDASRRVDRSASPYASRITIARATTSERWYGTSLLGHGFTLTATRSDPNLNAVQVPEPKDLQP